MAGWTVLIIDDRYDNRDSLAQFLELYGIRTYVADGGEQALAMLEDLEPTFVLTDLKMSGIDGWQTLQAIRANSNTKALPVIAITGNVSARDIALEKGFDGFIGKPISVETIIPDIYNIVSQKIHPLQRPA